jgi:LysM repeat protein
MVVASDKIIVENHNKLNFFNTATGQLISKTIELSTPTGGVGVRPIGVINDTLFVTESNGCLYTYSVPKPSQADTEKPTASIDLAATNQFSVQDGKNQIKIPVTISEEADMDVTVVDQTGLPVRTIGWDRHLKGTSYFYWDGKDSRGFNVTRGNYYIIVKLTDLSGNKNEYVANDKLINVTEGFGLTVKNANLRSDANTLSTVLRTIPVGSEVTVTGETGDWYQVEYRIVSAVLKGYISKPLINVPSNQQISNIVAGKTRINANVRNFAGTQYDTKKILPAGTDVSIVSAVGDWYVVEYQKDSYYRDQGYVAKYLITLPTSTSMVYTVISGDTLWKIAQKNGVTIDSIVKANNLDPAKPLYIGQKLTIVK